MGVVAGAHGRVVAAPRLAARPGDGAGAGNGRGRDPRRAGPRGSEARRAAAHRCRSHGATQPAHGPGCQRPFSWRPAVHQRACPSGRDRRGRADLPPLRQAEAPQRRGRRAPDLRRLPRQRPGHCAAAGAGRCVRRPPQRRRAAYLPELLAPRPAKLEALREVRQRAACRRDHRGRAGLPDLPAGRRNSRSPARPLAPEPPKAASRRAPGNATRPSTSCCRPGSPSTRPAGSCRSAALPCGGSPTLPPRRS